MVIRSLSILSLKNTLFFSKEVMEKRSIYTDDPVFSS